MDHEPTPNTNDNPIWNERPILPPILSMNITSGSWPPSSTSLPSTSLLSPSAASSTSSNTTMHENSSILSSPLRRNNHLYDPWSPRNEEQNTRTDYFTSSSPSSSYQRPSHALTSTFPSSPYQQHHHYRQNSAPQLLSSPQNNQRATNEFSPSSYDSKPTLAPIAALYENTTREDNNRNNLPIEMVLTLNSLSTPTLRNIENDIDQVIY